MVRGGVSLLGAGLGFLGAEWLIARRVLVGPINLAYLTLLGLLVGYLVSPPVARRAERLARRLRHVPPDAVLAAGVGATVALLITVLLNSVLERVPGFTWYLSLFITLLLVTASSWFFVVNRHLFGARSTPLTPLKDARGGSPKVVDTSAVIDGRIVGVAESNFLEGTLLVPRFVLAELQSIADADDPARRKRGRRGLEVLDRLGEVKGVRLEVVADDFADVGEVDAKLVRLCGARGADLITTDFNLGRVAALQGVRVLNLNGLANALKSNFLPGERLPLRVAKVGREPGQGLAYLEDGSMVVIEDAAHLVGKTVHTVVTSNLQTNVGRLVFAKVQDK